MKIEEAIQRLETHKEYISPHGRFTKEAIDMAIEALEKQIPKKAVMDYGFPEKIREVMICRGDKEKAEYKTDCCPVCKHPLGTSQFVKTQTGKAYGDSYCKRCGQKILWEEE